MIVERPFLSALLSAMLISTFLISSPASASIIARVDLTQQRMSVEVDGIHHATWSVSTARRGYRTPVGRYKPYLLERMHYSRLYDYTPMPHSVFFSRGYAIHGTTEVRRLGRPVSHGCIRLAPHNAKRLYGLIREHGLQNTTIEITR
jgi:lipoprotein-anchoring transpeptidase ErfK/SrfK